MRAYKGSDEERLHARDRLKDWAGEGFLSEAQYKVLEPETTCDLRRTNVFLRLTLFFFTVLIVVAFVGLFYGDSATFLLMTAGLSYGVTEFAVSEYRLYRYGIEEALCTCAVVFLCFGIYSAFSGRTDSPMEVAGAIACIWIWRRFGLPYAPLAAMLFVPSMVASWTGSSSARHAVIAAIYAVALVIVAIIRRPHRFTYLNQEYSIAEALLWCGVYLAINLQLASVDLFDDWWSRTPDTTAFPRPFYWTTWALTWCLPPAVLARGLRQRDRLIIIAGAVAAVLTLATNKLYLGWERHTWDPMLLGALLIAAALYLRRWLSQGPGEVRYGFTAQRLSGKDKDSLSVGSVALGFAVPSIIPAPTSTSDPRFGGGASGGGGASSDF